MKTEQMKATTQAPTQDRLATWDEIKRATSFTPDRVMELCYTNGTYCEVDSDLGGIVRYPAEEFEFFAFLSEMDDTSAN
jgi:hypothetical protein